MNLFMILPKSGHSLSSVLIYLFECLSFHGFSHICIATILTIYIYFFWIISSSYICLSLPWYWPTIVATFRYLSATDAALGKVCYQSLQLFSLRNYNEEIKPSFPEIQKLSYPKHHTLEYKCLYWTLSDSLLPK